MTAGEPYTTSVHVDADPERVFDYFTNPAAILRWMGDYAVLDPVPGGQFTLDINGVPVRGTYLAVDRPHRLLLSWGHAGSDRLPPGGSRVEVTFTPSDRGTTVTVVHSGLPAPEACQHRLGWAHFLERLVTAAGGGDPGPDPWPHSPPARSGTAHDERGEQLTKLRTTVSRHDGAVVLDGTASAPRRASRDELTSVLLSDARTPVGGAAASWPTSAPSDSAPVAARRPGLVPRLAAQYCALGNVAHRGNKQSQHGSSPPGRGPAGADIPSTTGDRNDW